MIVVLCWGVAFMVAAMAVSSFEPSDGAGFEVKALAALAVVLFLAGLVQAARLMTLFGAPERHDTPRAQRRR